MSLTKTCNFSQDLLQNFNEDIYGLKGSPSYLIRQQCSLVHKWLKTIVYQDKTNNYLCALSLQRFQFHIYWPLKQQTS